ncbi:MAG: metalloregulator ArsR/SmtB family transcription factor [Anaerolineae bacterium]|nr:metalloregulator ArsR/SmtB family transcription factor [Anaerolineae bacterium]
MNAYRVSARILKVLAHPTRVRLLYALRDSEECVCHLTALLRQRQAYVSQQLMFLRRAGLLIERKDGLRVYYRVKDARVFDVLDAANALAGITRAPSERKKIVACPCPKCVRARNDAKEREKTRKALSR